METIGDYLRSLAPSLWRQEKKTLRPPSWPPDMFALAASLLQRTGAYVRVVHPPWPPKGKGIPGPKKYLQWICNIGARWRHHCLQRELPRQVKGFWKTVVEKSQLPIEKVANDLPLSEALLHLCTTADEACWGAGVFGVLDEKDAESDHFLAKTKWLLTVPKEPGGSTLCDEVPASRVRVLPKMHTPQRGITIRSLTHNIALCPTDDACPEWHFANRTGEGEQLNLLLIPWPREVWPTHFYPVDKSAIVQDEQFLPFGAFAYGREPQAQELVTFVEATITKAEQIIGAVHAVVFPELALRQEELHPLQELIVDQRKLMLIAGVSSEGHDHKPGKNEAIFCIPLVGGMVTTLRQPKRHRWCLERSQIIQYGLSQQLDLEYNWWEHIDVTSRRFAMISLEPWLAVGMVICEDLARQDSVAELVRSVGPNLIIALLMDGPQTPERWSARFATVLSDDPGCSVLTLTSIGMAELSRPPYRPHPKRTIGLWKDAGSWAPVEINLPDGADAMVLCLSNKNVEERTADGRSDGGCTGQLCYSGLHPVFLGKGRRSES